MDEYLKDSSSWVEYAAVGPKETLYVIAGAVVATRARGDGQRLVGLKFGMENQNDAMANSNFIKLKGLCKEWYKQHYSEHLDKVVTLAVAAHSK